MFLLHAWFLGLQGEERVGRAQGVKSRKSGNTAGVTMSLSIHLDGAPYTRTAPSLVSAYFLVFVYFCMFVTHFYCSLPTCRFFTNLQDLLVLLERTTW